MKATTENTEIQNWIYENDEGNKTRYVLGTKGETSLVCFGVNPSIAEPNNLDRTLESVLRLAENNEFDSWIMLNIYPQRSIDPKGMHDELDIKIHKNNLFHIDKVLGKYNPPVIWAAWGNLIETRPYLKKCLEEIYSISLKYNCKWVSIGKPDVNGHPPRPNISNAELEPETFDIGAYLKRLKG